MRSFLCGERRTPGPALEHKDVGAGPRIRAARRLPEVAEGLPVVEPADAEVVGDPGLAARDPVGKQRWRILIARRLGAERPRDRQHRARSQGAARHQLDRQLGAAGDRPLKLDAQPLLPAQHPPCAQARDRLVRRRLGQPARLHAAHRGPAGQLHRQGVDRAPGHRVLEDGDQAAAGRAQVPQVALAHVDGGLIGVGKEPGGPVEFPLAEIEGIEDGANRRLIEDYAYWLANYG